MTILTWRTRQIMRAALLTLRYVQDHGAIGLTKTKAEEREGKHLHHVFKTPLWRSAMKLDTDHLLQPRSIQQIGRDRPGAARRAGTRRCVAHPETGHTMEPAERPDATRTGRL